MHAELRVEYFAEGADALGDQSIAYTLFHDVGCSRKHERVKVSWLEFARRLVAAEPIYLHKKACPLFSGGLYGDAPSTEGSFKTQANLVTVHLIEGDHDAQLCSFEQAVERLRAANVRCVIHTTASHRPGEDERWHAIAPLSESCAPAERDQFVGRLNRILGGVLAPESWRAAQGFFVGRVASVDYRAALIDGRTLDVAPEFEPLPCQFKSKARGNGSEDAPGLMTGEGALAAFAAGSNRRNAMLHMGWKLARDGLSVDEILRELHRLLEQSPDCETNAAHYAELRREAALIAVDRFEKHGLKFKSRREKTDTSTSTPDNTDWPSAEGFDDLPLEAPFPVDALPPLLRGAVEDVIAYTQCPAALAANSVLAAASLAASGHLNVTRSGTDSIPAALFLLAIAQSGERKTTCDQQVFAEVYEFERAESERQRPFYREAESKRETWRATRDALRRTLAKLKVKLLEGANEDEDREVHAQQARVLAELEKLDREEPPEPWPFNLLESDFTREGLAKSLALGFPVRGIVDSEGLAVLGAIGAQEEKFGGFLAMLSKYWDARDSTRVTRATTESYTVDSRHTRVTCSLMIQPEVLRAQVSREGAVARLSGFLARFLICHPHSRIGTRSFVARGAMTRLATFQARIVELLGRPLPTDEHCRLAPPAVPMEAEALALWQTAFADIERSMGALAINEELRDFGSKSAEQALRLAGVFHAITEPMFWTCAVSAETMRSGIAVAAHYLAAARLALNEFALPATKDAWTLWQRLTPHGGETLSRGALRKACRCAVVREEKRLEAALDELERRGLIRQQRDVGTRGRPSKLVLIRPDAGGGAARA